MLCLNYLGKDRLKLRLMFYKQKIEKEIIKALSGKTDKVTLEKPKVKEFGDVSTNIAMLLAKDLRKNPLDIANELKEKIKVASKLISHIDVVKPGFINIFVDDYALAESLVEAHKLGEKYGLMPSRSEERVLVEYVSANPTGDLHIGHGRQAVIGDSLANLLKACGYEVKREFYVNDYGEQITRLKEDAKKILSEVKKGKVTLPSEMEDFEYKVTISTYMYKLKDVSQEDIGEKLIEEIKANQKTILKLCRVEFDDWFSETTLHENGQVKKTLQKLKEKGVTYEQEGAIWFKAKDFGDVRDRVLVRSDGRSTYLLADIAYHINKFDRGNKLLITVWGADHHGQEIGLKGALKALGFDDTKLEIVFVQLVSLKKEGEEVKMSKRAGTVVHVEDVLNEVGPDAFRYFLVESHPNNRMVFDIELAKKQDKENPVYYIQYAHARCCSIFRQLSSLSKDISSWKKDFMSSPEVFMPLFKTNNNEYNATKNLVLRILDFPEEVTSAANARSPGRIANYLKDLASEFHQFYTVCRVLSDDENITKARIGLIETVKITIKNALEILGISAPQSM